MMMTLAMCDYDTGWHVRRCDPITVRQWKVEPLWLTPCPLIEHHLVHPYTLIGHHLVHPYSLIGHHPLPSYGVLLCPPWGPALHFLLPQQVIQYTTLEHSHHEETYNSRW